MLDLRRWLRAGARAPLTARLAGPLLGAALASSLAPAAAAQPAFTSCEGEARPPACSAIRGDRSEGWLAQTRAEVLATRGMVTTSQALATQAGLRVLQQGGNAIDAAVAAAAALSVVEPMNVGPAGDLFAIVYIAKEKKLYALDASGVAGKLATPARFAELGYRANGSGGLTNAGGPMYGALTVTVPGSVWGWDALLRRFGTRGLKEVLQPAVEYAENGFPVSQRIAHDWRLPKALPTEGCCQRQDPDSVATWYVDGKPPVTGQVFRNPDLARSLRLLQAKGPDVFYRGEIARAIVDKLRPLGGTFDLADMAAYRGRWIEPVRTSYQGHDVYELPPPSQAWATLEMLNILEACVPGWTGGRTLAQLGPRDPLYWHLLVETKKLAYADLTRFNADPAFAPAPVEKLLSKAYAASLCDRVDPNKATPPGSPPRGPEAGDTVVLSTADAEGNMVAWVNSSFASFGSGLTVPGYGLTLHNRGALFSLDPKSPNVVAPGKRPYNTLAAGFVMKEGAPVMSLLLMGGDMQAQGHAQVLVDILDLGANLQMATDMGRFRHSQATDRLVLEPTLAAALAADLSARGHLLGPPASDGMGGFQAIAVERPGTRDRAYRAGSDHRKDGQAAGF